MAVSVKTAATYIGASAGIDVYRVDLSALGFSTIRGIIIDDDGVFRTGTAEQRLSGIDLDYVVISNTFTSNPTTARGLIGQNVFNFGAGGVVLQNGYIQPAAGGEQGAWPTNGLYGTFGRDQLNNGIATLGVSDGGFFPIQGFTSLGHGGRIGFNLTSDLAAAGNYLYFGQMEQEGAFISVTDTVGIPQLDGFDITGSFSSDYIAMQQGMNAGMGAGADTINGSDREDTIYGGAGNDLLLGNDGADQIFGGDGLDQLFGGAGDDYLQADGGASNVLVGEAGSDTLYGGAGDDYLVGGDGNDTLVGLGGVNSLYGGAGNDYMVSGDGPNNVLDGGAGANSLWGGAGSDYAVGGELADILVTGGGDDYIFGNAGNDAIYAGAGTDYIFSNAGNDFVYTDDLGFSSRDYIYVGPGTGVDTVVDFRAGVGPDADVIVMTGTAARSFATVQATQAGIYTVIQVTTTDQLYLYNVTPAQLTASNFIFL